MVHLVIGTIFGDLPTDYVAFVIVALNIINVLGALPIFTYWMDGNSIECYDKWLPEKLIWLKSNAEGLCHNSGALLLHVLSLVDCSVFSLNFSLALFSFFYLSDVLAGCFAS